MRLRDHAGIEYHSGIRWFYKGQWHKRSPHPQSACYRVFSPVEGVNKAHPMRLYQIRPGDPTHGASPEEVARHLANAGYGAMEPPATPPSDPR